MKTAEILVCESNFLVRLGLKTVIDKHPYFNVSGEVSSMDELESNLVNEKYDIITIDFSEEGNFGIHSLSMIREMSPNVRVLVVSDEKDKRTIYDVLSRGVNHYITKKCNSTEIYAALEACKSGQKYYCAKILDIIIDRTFQQNEEDTIQDNSLTPREREIVQLIAKGKMAKEISGILEISVHTIYTHRKNIMKKLNISSPVELITYAINSGIVKI